MAGFNQQFLGKRSPTAPPAAPAKTQGYQFAHMEHFTVAGRADKVTHRGNINGKETNGGLAFRGAGWSASDILAEAMRMEGHCNHVEMPRSPVSLHGYPNAFMVMADVHAWLEHTEAATGRKYRKDSPSLTAGVISFPTDRIEDWPEYRDKALAWLKKRYGKTLRCVVEHLDEDHPHMHFYLVPEYGVGPDGRKWANEFGTVHEGYAAKITERRVTRVNNAGSDKGAKTMLAFQNAMRGWQNDLYNEVSVVFALARTGPRRDRLTRHEYVRQTQQREEIADNVKKARYKKKEAEEAAAAARADQLEAFDMKRQAEENAEYVRYLADWEAAIAINEGIEAGKREMERIRLKAEYEARAAYVQEMARGKAAASEVVEVAQIEAEQIKAAAETYSHQVAERTLTQAQEMITGAEDEIEQLRRQAQLDRQEAARRKKALDWVGRHQDSPARLRGENVELREKLAKETTLRARAEERVSHLEEIVAFLKIKLLDMTRDALNLARTLVGYGEKDADEVVAQLDKEQQELTAKLKKDKKPQ